MAKIVIIGGGFGGLVTAERLQELLDHGANQITLVAPGPRFTFYPGLVQLAFGECSADDITFDLRARATEKGVRFIQGEMIRINPRLRTVELAGPDFRGDLFYDYLVIATGRRLATEKVPGFFENSHHLLGISPSIKFGTAVNAFREGTIIVGLCPEARLPVPVCETAFALARKFEPQISTGTVKIKVVFPGSLSEAFGGASLHKALEAAFAKHGINVLYDVPIVDINANDIVSSAGHRIQHDLLMLVPPFRGQALLHDIGVTDEQDFVRVDGGMRIHNMERAYAVGDVVAFSGPKFAHMAVRQATTAADNVAAEINGEEPAAEYYHEIATVIDAGGSDSIYLHYGIWDDELYRLKKGRLWSWAKEMHDSIWRRTHRPKST